MSTSKPGIQVRHVDSDEVQVRQGLMQAVQVPAESKVPLGHVARHLKVWIVEL